MLVVAANVIFFRGLLWNGQIEGVYVLVFNVLVQGLAKPVFTHKQLQTCKRVHFAYPLTVPLILSNQNYADVHIWYRDARPLAVTLFQFRSLQAGRLFCVLFMSLSAVIRHAGQLPCCCRCDFLCRSFAWRFICCICRLNEVVRDLGLSQRILGCCDVVG
jgi:hypothetical protein